MNRFIDRKQYRQSPIQNLKDFFSGFTAIGNTSHGKSFKRFTGKKICRISSEVFKNRSLDNSIEGLFIIELLFYLETGYGPFMCSLHSAFCIRFFYRIKSTLIESHD